MDLDYITRPENFIPLEDSSFFSKAESVLSGQNFEPIDDLLILLQKSFCHDIWQRLYQKGFNEDPFELPAYRLFFFLNTFRVFLTKLTTDSNIPDSVKSPTDEIVKSIYSRLYRHFIEAAKDPHIIASVSWDGQILSNYSLDIKPEWDLILRLVANESLTNELEGYLGAITTLIDVAKKKHSGKTDRALSKALFINYASILEIIFAAINTSRQSGYEFASKNLGSLIRDYTEMSLQSLDSETILLSYFFNHLRNLIHIGNVTIRNTNLGYNLTVAIPLYGFLRSLSLDLLTKNTN